MTTMTFDADGFATASGLILAHYCNADGVYTHSAEEYVSIGTTLSAGAYPGPPPEPRAGFAVHCTEMGWAYIEDHRGEVVYSTTDKSKILIDAVGPYPAGTTPLEPSALSEWDGEAWVVSAEQQAVKKAEDIAKVREAINALRDRKINGGVYVEAVDKWIDTDATAERNILSVKASYDLFGDMEIVWTCADNSILMIDKDKLILIWQALMTAKTGNHANAMRHKAALEQADDPLAYDYSGGWTQCYHDYLKEQNNE